MFNKLRRYIFNRRYPSGIRVQTKRNVTRYTNINGDLHREDGPAVEWADGTKTWYQNGKRHREDGPAVEYADGSKAWYQNDMRHREDGPAVELVDGYKVWYQSDRCHRVDGPALEWPDGYKEWWLNGNKLAPSEVLAYIKLTNLSSDGQTHV